MHKKLKNKPQKKKSKYFFSAKQRQKREVSVKEDVCVWGVNYLSSSAPRWPKPASRTRACSPGTAEPPGCWQDCLGLARPVETVLGEMYM